MRPLQVFFSTVRVTFTFLKLLTQLHGRCNAIYLPAFKSTVPWSSKTNNLQFVRHITTVCRILMPAAQRLRQRVAPKKTLVLIYQATWHRILNNCHLNTQSQENLKSHFKLCSQFSSRNGTGMVSCHYFCLTQILLYCNSRQSTKDHESRIKLGVLSFWIQCRAVP